MREVLLAEHVREVLCEIAARAHPDETGGVLLGVRARRSVWITEVVELVGERSTTRYTVPEGRTIRAVEDARGSIDPRLGYLGEWHSHPAGKGPSRDDAATMRAVAWYVPRPPRGGPVLVLVRRRADRYDIAAYRARFPLLRPVRLVLTGPLPVQ